MPLTTPKPHGDELTIAEFQPHFHETDEALTFISADCSIEERWSAFPGLIILHDSHTGEVVGFRLAGAASIPRCCD